MPVGVMLASMSSRELGEWEAFFALEHENQLQQDAARRAEAKLEQRRK